MKNNRLSIICLGTSGKKIQKEFLLMNPENIGITFIDGNSDVIADIGKCHDVQVAIIANLEDPDLHPIILQIQKSNIEHENRLIGYFLYPHNSNLEVKVESNRTLRMLNRLVATKFVIYQVMNLPELSSSEKEPVWPIVWADNQLNIDEKQIIWELLLFQLRIKNLTDFKKRINALKLNYPLSRFEYLTKLAESDASKQSRHSP
jgi:hypothetical protein